MAQRGRRDCDPPGPASPHSSLGRWSRCPSPGFESPWGVSADKPLHTSKRAGGREGGSELRPSARGQSAASGDTWGAVPGTCGWSPGTRLNFLYHTARPLQPASHGGGGAQAGAGQGARLCPWGAGTPAGSTPRLGAQPRLRVVPCTCARTAFRGHALISVTSVPAPSGNTAQARGPPTRPFSEREHAAAEPLPTVPQRGGPQPRLGREAGSEDTASASRPRPLPAQAPRGPRPCWPRPPHTSSRLPRLPLSFPSGSPEPAALPRCSCEAPPTWPPRSILCPEAPSGARGPEAAAGQAPAGARGRRTPPTHQGPGVRLREEVAQEHPQVGRPRLQPLEVLEDGVALEGRRTRRLGGCRPRGVRATASSPRPPSHWPPSCFAPRAAGATEGRGREEQEPLPRC